MRAGGYNLFDPIIIQDLNILVGHHLEREFVACAAYRITGAHFFLAKNSVFNLCFI